MSGSQDPSLYPGTDVLRKKPGITDQDQLRRFEYGATMLRQADAPTFPMTAQGFKDTHAHLFQDVYEWAGQLRTINFTKEESSFARVAMLDGLLESRFQQLRWNDHLQKLSADRFAVAAADHVAELNRIHAFREGNGRTMRLHLEQLAQQAGHQLDPRLLDKAQWDAASVRAFDGSRADLARVIAGAMSPAERVSVEAAIGRTLELHPAAVDEVRDRTKAIRDLIQAGKSSTITTKELGGLREEMAAIGAPDSNAALTRLQRLQAAGTTEIMVLTGQTISARDRLNAMREGADRAIHAGARLGVAAEGQAQGSAAEAAARKAVTPPAKPAGASYWEAVASAGRQDRPGDTAPTIGKTHGPRR